MGTPFTVNLGFAVWSDTGVRVAKGKAPPLKVVMTDPIYDWNWKGAKWPKRPKKPKRSYHSHGDGEPHSHSSATKIAVASFSLLHIWSLIM